MEVTPNPSEIHENFPMVSFQFSVLPLHHNSVKRIRIAFWVENPLRGHSIANALSDFFFFFFCIFSEQNDSTGLAPLLPSLHFSFFLSCFIIHMHTHTRTCKHPPSHAHTLANTPTPHTFTHTQAPTHPFTHTHKHTHTHTHTWNPLTHILKYTSTHTHGYTHTLKYTYAFFYMEWNPFFFGLSLTLLKNLESFWYISTDVNKPWSSFFWQHFWHFSTKLVSIKALFFDLNTCHCLLPIYLSK